MASTCSTSPAQRCTPAPPEPPPNIEPSEAMKFFWTYLTTLPHMLAPIVPAPGVCGTTLTPPPNARRPALRASINLTPYLFTDEARITYSPLDSAKSLAVSEVGPPG